MCVTFESLNKQYTGTDRTNAEVEAWLWLWLWCGEYSEVEAWLWCGVVW